MHQQSTKVCPKCLQAIQTSFIEHFQEICLQKSSVSKLSEKVAFFSDQTCICARCFNTFTKDKWQYHQKKIRTHCSGFAEYQSKQFTPIKLSLFNDEQLSERIYTQSISKKPFSESKQRSGDKRQGQSISQSRLLSASLFSDRHAQPERITYTKQIGEDETILLLLLNLLDAKSKIPLLDWVKRNKKIKSVYLQEFFERFLQKTLKRLWEVIKVPTFQMLQERATLKWKLFLKQPQDIFNQQLVLECVKDMSANKRNRALLSLNKLYKTFYGDIFPKFIVEAIQPKKKRNELPLRTKDYFKILEQLFATRERDMIHIGIDLYLIFQSAQRIISDKANIAKGVEQLLKDRKSNPSLCQLEMTIKKTGKQGKFILSEQLCQLLQLFDWKSFFSNGRIYQRMRGIFGFPVYSIKKCVFAEFELQKGKQTNIKLQNLANHGSQKVSLIYAKDGVQTNIKFIKDNLRIPNLKVCPITRTELLNFLGKRLDFKKHVTIYENWLQRLKQKMHKYNRSLCDYYDDRQQVIDEKGLIIFDQSERQGFAHPEHDVFSSQPPQQGARKISDQLQNERVQIQSLQYSFKDSKFKFHELFIESSITYCQKCDLQFFEKSESGRICILCSGHYHSQCLPKFCLCVKQPFSFPDRGVPFNSSKQNVSVSIKMPSEYLNHNNQDMLDQIIFLLAARKFRYSSTAYYQGNLAIDQQLIKKLEVERITLTNFEQYQRGSYFPPLVLGISGQTTTSGSGFGLFAAEDIPKHCFIGQYSADILSGADSIHIRRIDSVFNLVQGTRPSNTILVAPFKRCGYTCLINAAQEEEANCYSQKVQINGYLRIILYTKRLIRKGIELCFCYSQGCRFVKSKLAKKVALPTLPTKPSDIKRCGLYNLGATCYINSTIQFLKILIGEKIKTNPIEKMEQYLNQIFLELEREQKAYNPRFYVQQILKTINNNGSNQSQKFTLGDQADAHEFLIKLIENSSDNTKQMIQGTTISTITCNKCANSSSNEQKFTCLSLQITPSSGLSNILNVPIVEDVEYLCEVCSHKRQTKTTRIEKQPEILIVNMKRFSKNLTKIQFPVKDFLSLRDYKLSTTIVHSGKLLKLGHYYALEYLSNWICKLDDQNVDFLQINSSQSQGYIFGYKKLNRDGLL